jgi:PST family polysaccharide transporter
MLICLQEKGATIFRRAARSGFAQSAASLYLIRGAAYVAPLIAVPWLARVLTPAGLGMVAIVQALGSPVTLLVDYGFSFSATKQVAVNQNSPEQLSILLAAVHASKVLLAILALAATVAVLPLLPFDSPDVLIYAGLFAAIGQAFNMTWYFLGIGRMPALSIFETVLRIGGALAIFVFVHKPSDAWIVFVLQGSVSWLAWSAGIITAYRNVPFTAPTIPLVRECLVRGWSVLTFRVAETSYTTCNAVLLGLFCPPAVVGVYAAAEKIARSMVIALLDPIQRAVYPLVARALAEDEDKARRVIRLSTAATASVAIAVALVVFIFAEDVVRYGLGPGFDDVVPTLRILLTLPLAIALKWSLGLNWMLPIGMSGPFNAVIAISVLIHISATFLLAPRWGHVGMGVAVAITEAAIPILVWFILCRRGLNPFLSRRPERRASELSWSTRTSAL